MAFTQRVCSKSKFCLLPGKGGNHHGNRRLHKWLWDSELTQLKLLFCLTGTGRIYHERVCNKLRSEYLTCWRGPCSPAALQLIISDLDATSRQTHCLLRLMTRVCCRELSSGDCGLCDRKAEHAVKHLEHQTDSSPMSVTRAISCFCS